MLFSTRLYASFVLLFSFSGAVHAAVVSGDWGVASPSALGSSASLSSNGNVMKNPEARKALQDGQAQLATGKLEAAEALFQQASALEPSAYPPKIGLADVALRRARLKESEGFVQQALALAPQSAEVATVAGRIALAMGKTADAEKQYLRAVSLDRQFLIARLDLGEIYLSSKRIKEAVATFRAAVALGQNHPGAHYGLGRSLALMGDAEGAEKQFALSAQAAPASAVPLIAMAEIQAARDDTARSLATLDQAAKLEPTNLLVVMTRADVLARGGEVEKALQLYKDSLVRVKAPLSAVLHMKMGNLYQAKKQLDAAAASFERAIQDDPKSHLGYNNLAWLVVQRKGDLAQALKWAQRALELSPKNSNYEDTLAQVHLARGELDLALAASRRAVASAPGVPDYHYTLGLIQEAKGQPALALSSYDAALKTGKPFSAKSDAIARRDGLSSRKAKP